MDVYQEGAAVTVTLPFEDSAGTELTPTSARYRVLDKDRAEVVAWTAHTINTGDVAAKITVPLASNTLGVGLVRDVRIVELEMTTPEGVVISDESYIIEKNQVLTVFTNTFQTYEEAVLNSIDMGNLEAWNYSDDRDRKAALIESYRRIGKLRLSPYPDVDDLPDALDTVFHTGDFRMNVDVTQTEWDLFPAVFQESVKLAQIAEADIVLNGDPMWDKRSGGVISETIGESSQFFRPAKPLTLPVSARALRYLKGYVIHDVVVVRG